jgi:2,4-diketo-3-deoxy-L-fuconate hydrolase
VHIGNLAGRAVLIQQETALDIGVASGDRFGPDPLRVFQQWAAFTAWAAGADFGAAKPFDSKDLLAPVPNPGQIFAIGLNYADHADEANLAHPADLVVFTKFASSLAGPNVTVELPSKFVDYETELVVIIGAAAHRVDQDQARAAVAGFCVGQDYSERVVQRRGPAPQFSLGKSYPNFSPFGPAVVTLDALQDPDALPIGAVLEGPTAAGQGGSWKVQDGNTADLIFPVARIIADLSQVVSLAPGDLIFTGTPAGVGMARGIYLQPGDVLTGPALALEQMPGARWYPDARVNYAENVLRHAGDPDRAQAAAILHLEEDGATREISWRTLAGQVASLAAALRRMRVQPGDVVAVLPNIPEAIIGLLASGEHRCGVVHLLPRPGGEGNLGSARSAGPGGVDRDRRVPLQR